MEYESTTMESIPEQSSVPPYVVPPTPEEEPLTGGEAREEPPKVVKVRKPRTKKTTAPTIAIPDINDDKFWTGLLRTQREAERATKLQRISEFSLL